MRQGRRSSQDQTMMDAPNSRLICYFCGGRDYGSPWVICSENGHLDCPRRTLLLACLQLGFFSLFLSGFLCFQRQDAVSKVPSFEDLEYSQAHMRSSVSSKKTIYGHSFFCKMPILRTFWDSTFSPDAEQGTMHQQSDVT